MKELKNERKGGENERMNNERMKGRKEVNRLHAFIL